ncbi:MAG: hypothetical protein RL078_1745 [Bacteroidota bacterium]
MSLFKNLYRFFSSKWQKLYMEYKVDFQPRYGHGKPPHAELYQVINNERDLYQTLLQEMLKHQEVFFSWKKKNDESNPSLPAYNNDFLPGLDMIAIYTMIKQYQPKRYVEVGSGNSTKVAYQAAKDLNNTEIISIDPQPRAEIDQLADQIIRKPFENIDFDFLFSLEANDILFIDNSHRILPNSDATVFFLEVLPKLAKGVIVHIHDIYLPYDYPQFMADRFYSEQYGLAMYLLANPEKYKTILPNFFISEDPQLSEIVAPIFAHPSLAGVEKHGGSFWLQIQ